VALWFLAQQRNAVSSDLWAIPQFPAIGPSQCQVSPEGFLIE
jgi:hypothetical protein